MPKDDDLLKQKVEDQLLEELRVARNRFMAKRDRRYWRSRSRSLSGSTTFYLTESGRKPYGPATSNSVSAGAERGLLV